MIEHVSLPCSRAKVSRAFYEKALAPLGYKLAQEFPGTFGFMAEGHTSFWIMKAKLGDPTHIAFLASSRAAVDAFYEAAMGAGAKDNGKPGLRDYSPNYYAAFVRDPDGHNVEAVTYAKAAPKRTAKAPKAKAPKARTQRG